MGVFAEAVRGLINAGAPPDLILETIENMEATCLRVAIQKAEGEKVTQKREEYSEDFARFWKQYPDTTGMDKKEAYRVWRRIPVEERDAALRAVPKFATFIQEQRRKRPDYPTLHADRFLKRGRAESLLEGETPLADGSVAVKMFVETDDPRFKTLAERFKSERGKPVPVSGGGWYFPKEWMETV
jgi:hypothetical protein